MEISIEININAPLEEVWAAWITPDDIKHWNFASDEWCCPDAQIDFTVGGKFNYRMEAKDGSMGFDFEGTFTVIRVHERIEYRLDDTRNVSILFSRTESGTQIVEIFDAEDEHSVEQQRQGWQGILDNFRKHVEAKEQKVIQGSCHCGAVQWQFEGQPDGATACNCTVCRRYGVLWAYDYEDEGIKIAGKTAAYVRGKAIEFHFCPVCGSVAFWRSLQVDDHGRRRIAVNLRLAEPQAVAQIPIDHFDGYDTFEDLPRDGRYVADYWF